MWTLNTTDAQLNRGQTKQQKEKNKLKTNLLF